jgi:hypothetical protein
MPAGLQVINDNGIVQIDELYRNLVFIQKWTFSTGGDHTFTTSAGRFAPTLVFYSNSVPTIPTAGILLLQSTKNGDGSYTYRVNGIGEVYLFDVPPPPAAHGFGLQVFNAQGNIVFDSSTKPMVVRDSRRFGGPVNFNVGGDYYAYPIQTLSVAPESYGSTIVEDTRYGTFAAYQKPSNEKWGWVINGPFSCVCYINNPSGGGPEDTPYGDGDSAIHKGLGALHASGNNFVATFRDYIYSGTYWNGGVNWNPTIAFVDITGL